MSNALIFILGSLCLNLSQSVKVFETDSVELFLLFCMQEPRPACFFFQTDGNIVRVRIEMCGESCKDSCVCPKITTSTLDDICTDSRDIR